MHGHLPAHTESIEIDSPQCPSCGLSFADFPGSEDSEVLEIEVCAYRRVIRRRRYRKTCACKATLGIISALPPARLIERGKYGISVWCTFCSPSSSTVSQRIVSCRIWLIAA